LPCSISSFGLWCFVRAVGLGPIAGILAIMVAETGVLSKLFAEAIENIDTKQVDGIRSTAPAGSPNCVTACCANPAGADQPGAVSIESNSREATILGLVGAGGIGLRLSERIQINAWDQVAYVIVLILITVASIDSLSAVAPVAADWRTVAADVACRPTTVREEVSGHADNRFPGPRL